MDAELAALIALAEEKGYRQGKEFIIKVAEIWCNTISASAAFHPDQLVRQGQVKTANNLLEYLKK